MSDDERGLRYDGPRHEGAMRTSPYPTSRLAPVHDLVDVASQIQRADASIASHATGKLRVIADQIRALQAQAAAVLAKAQEDTEIHRAECRFEKRPGKVYHLYRRASGAPFLSMIAPDEWGGGRASDERTFVASYRLEADLSWTPAADADARDREDQAIRALLSGK